jgi:hypothetical protein
VYRIQFGQNPETISRKTSGSYGKETRTTSSTFGLREKERKRVKNGISLGSGYSFEVQTLEQGKTSTGLIGIYAIFIYMTVNLDFGYATFFN